MCKCSWPVEVLSCVTVGGTSQKALQDIIIAENLLAGRALHLPYNTFSCFFCFFLSEKLLKRTQATCCIFSHIMHNKHAQPAKCSCHPALFQRYSLYPHCIFFLVFFATAWLSQWSVATLPTVYVPSVSEAWNASAQIVQHPKPCSTTCVRI